MENHWHDALEILFVLDGSIHLGIGNSVFHLQKEDIVVINSNEIHTTRSDSSNLVLALQISGDWIKKYIPFQNFRVACNSCIKQESPPDRPNPKFARHHAVVL
jgi:xylan 1,4-beta-xylosidase